MRKPLLCDICASRPCPKCRERLARIASTESFFARVRVAVHARVRRIADPDPDLVTDIKLVSAASLLSSAAIVYVMHVCASLINP